MAYNPPPPVRGMYVDSMNAGAAVELEKPLLGRLADEISVLENMISSLEDRIGPMLGAAGPEKAIVEAPQRSLDAMSPTRSAIEIATAQIRDQLSRLTLLIDRIDL